MAKQPVTRDRFRIFAETSSENMGPLLAQLTRMGLENIGYELITDVRLFGSNKPRKVHETTAAEDLVVWMKDHPTFKSAELRLHFTEAGRNSTATYSAINKLIEDGLLKKLDNGFYQSTDIKHIAPPTPAAEPKESQRGKHSAVYYDVPNKDIVAQAIKGKKRITMRELRDVFIAEGRNEKSISPILTVMAKAKLVKNVAPGEYEVLKVAKPTAPKPGKPTKKQQAAHVALNGAATPTTEENAHG